ncbi:hypothetical protein PUN28_008300 [Cardiocondyla obscurior]|uniref:Uncharacterized protein n=1 Tax=Cardiocondyla obscurior TaxID=286306 RepID=A0AAW2FZ49_9HYME
MRRADHFVRIDRLIPIPATLADLLYSLGRFNSRSRGVIYHVTPLNRPAQPEPCWQINDVIVAKWCQTMGRFQSMYQMREFPSNADYDSRPLVLTTISDEDRDGVVVRSDRTYTNEPAPTNAYVQFVKRRLKPSPNLHGVDMTGQAQILYRNVAISGAS